MKLRVSAVQLQVVQTKQVPYPLQKFKRPSRRSWAAWRSGKRVARAGLLCMVRQARPAPCHRLRCHCRVLTAVFARAESFALVIAGHALDLSNGCRCWTSWSPSNSRKPQLSGLQLLSPAAGCLRARLQVHEAAAVDGRQQPARCTSCCCIAARTVASKLALRSQ